MLEYAPAALAAACKAADWEAQLAPALAWHGWEFGAAAARCEAMLPAGVDGAVFAVNVNKFAMRADKKYAELAVRQRLCLVCPSAFL